jgi:nitrogen fixation protein NifX
MGVTWKIAIGSVDGSHINQHFGRCDRFLIYRLEPEGTYSIIEDRRCHREAEAVAVGHDTYSLHSTAALLADCSIVLVSQIGPGARAVLYERGIQAMAVEAPIEQALERLVHFLRSGRGAILQ